MSRPYFCLQATILSETQHQLHNSSFRGCCNHDYWNVCSHLRLYSLPSCILHGVAMVTGAFKSGQWNPRKFHGEGRILKIAESPRGKGTKHLESLWNTLFDFLHTYTPATPLWKHHSTHRWAGGCVCELLLKMADSLKQRTDEPPAMILRATKTKMRHYGDTFFSLLIKESWTSDWNKLWSHSAKGNELWATLK